MTDLSGDPTYQWEDLFYVHIPESDPKLASALASVIEPTSATNPRGMKVCGACGQLYLGPHRCEFSPEAQAALTECGHTNVRVYADGDVDTRSWVICSHCEWDITEEWFDEGLRDAFVLDRVDGVIERWRRQYEVTS